MYFILSKRNSGKIKTLTKIIIYTREQGGSRPSEHALFHKLNLETNVLCSFLHLKIK